MKINCHLSTVVRFVTAIFLTSAWGMLMVGCSSSTSTTPPPVSPTGSLNPPTTIEFNSVPTGRWHDTTFSVANAYSDSIVITGSTFSTPSVAGSRVKDTMDLFPIAVPGGQSAVLHAEFFAADSGSQTAIDTIAFKHAGSAMSVTAPVHAYGVYRAPGIGSTFTFDESTVDTNGVPGPHTDSTYTILANSLSYAGKTNVLMVLNPAGDTGYYHIESNGDVAEYFSVPPIDFTGTPLTAPVINIPASWIIVPFGSHVTQSVTLFDTTEAGSVRNGGNTYPAQIHLTVMTNNQYAGDEVVPAGTSSYAAQKAIVTGVFHGQVSITGIGVVADLKTTHTTTSWYAPKIEFFVKQIKAVQDIGSTKTTTTTEVLTKYNLH